MVKGLQARGLGRVQTSRIHVDEEASFRWLTQP